VHDPLQSALHLVAQVAVVGTLTQLVVHLSLQHAPQDAVHSAIDEADVVMVVASGSSPPSSVSPPSEVVVVELDEVHEALHPDSHRWLQSVVQSNMAGLVEQEVVHMEPQLEVQVAAASAVHWESQDLSSWAAHALMQVAGAHCVVQLLLATISQFALASISMLPHSLTTAARASCASAVSAAKGTAASVQTAHWFLEVFMTDVACNA
jgi:hypothetical protein